MELIRTKRPRALITLPYSRVVLPPWLRRQLWKDDVSVRSALKRVQFELSNHSVVCRLLRSLASLPSLQSNFEAPTLFLPSGQQENGALLEICAESKCVSTVEPLLAVL